MYIDVQTILYFRTEWYTSAHIRSMMLHVPVQQYLQTSSIDLQIYCLNWRTGAYTAAVTRVWRYDVPGKQYWVLQLCVMAVLYIVGLASRRSSTTDYYCFPTLRAHAAYLYTRYRVPGARTIHTGSHVCGLLVQNMPVACTKCRAARSKKKSSLHVSPD